MPRLVPPECILRPSQIQDLPQLAALDRRWVAEMSDDRRSRWRNWAGLAFLVFAIVIALKDLRLLGWVLIGFAPIYGILGWFYYIYQHPPRQEWVNYWVVECNDRIAAAAKWEHFDSYSELQQLYVLPKWRFNRLGSALVDRLLSQTQQPIYLITDEFHQKFFARFGFKAITWDDLPQNFPLPEFVVPGLERSRLIQVPMVRPATPISGRRSATTPQLKPTTRATMPGWQGIKPEIDDRPIEY
jgi:amino-acid N-acetyltransferase